jgi:hypothetical protein
MPSRPRDECPYHKPFPDGFRDCPAYQPAQYVPLDMHYRVLLPVWTCGHLDVRTIPGSHFRHYALCRVGDAVARGAYVDSLQAGRLTVLRSLQEQLAGAISEVAAEMWAAKGLQLQAGPEGDGRSAATEELHRVGARLMVRVDAFLEEHASELDRLGLPMEACRSLVEDLVADWIDQPDARLPDVTDQALERFPVAVRGLFRPEVPTA